MIEYNILILFCSLVKLELIKSGRNIDRLFHFARQWNFFKNSYLSLDTKMAINVFTWEHRS